MRVAVALVVVVVLAGCSDAPKDNGPATSATGSSGPNGTEPGEAAAQNGSVPPTWQVGQSWRWRIESTRLADAIETNLVVLTAGGATYDIGTTNLTTADDAYPFHLLGLGAVDATTLAWEAHGAPVQFLRFPLTDGERFTTDFWSAAGAEVEIRAANVIGPSGPEPGFRSTAYYAGSDSVFMEADYASARGQFVRVATRFGATEPFAEASLIGDGDNETGHAFRATDLARWTAQSGDPSTLTPRQAQVGDADDLVLLACFLPADPGNYQAYLTVQSGTISCGSQGTLQGSGYQSYSISTGPGQANLAAIVVGQGSITVEAFAIDTGE